MIRTALDMPDKLVRTTIVGLLTVHEARTYKQELTAIASEARDRFGLFCLIADTLDAPVETQEVIAELPLPHQLMHHAKDRWAVIVGSNLAKMQATRLLAHPQAQAFLSAKEAETWVRARETDCCAAI